MSAQEMAWDYGRQAYCYEQAAILLQGSSAATNTTMKFTCQVVVQELRNQADEYRAWAIEQQRMADEEKANAKFTVTVRQPGRDNFTVDLELTPEQWKIVQQGASRA